MRSPFFASDFSVLQVWIVKSLEQAAHRAWTPQLLTWFYSWGHNWARTLWDKGSNYPADRKALYYS